MDQGRQLLDEWVQLPFTIYSSIAILVSSESMRVAEWWSARWSWEKSPVDLWMTFWGCSLAVAF